MDKIGDINIETLEEIEYIEIDKNQVPYSFSFDHRGNIFEIDIRYNDEYDYFTADLYILKDSEKVTLILGLLPALANRLPHFSCGASLPRRRAW